MSLALIHLGERLAALADERRTLPVLDDVGESHSTTCSSCRCAISTGLWNATSEGASPQASLVRRLVDVLESANGCELCSLIVSCTPRLTNRWLLSSSHHELNIEILFGGERLWKGCLDVMIVRATINYRGYLSELHHEGRFRVSTDPGSLLQDRVEKDFVDPDPLSQGSLRTINKWIAACTKNTYPGGHTSCVSRLRKPPLPTRVIDLLPGETMVLNYRGQLSAAVKLVNTGHMRGNYIALSHCWGKSRQKPSGNAVTTRSSLRSHMEGIQIQSLPKTFQDAIKVSQALNIRYLWIDSLCIMQDDLRDWEHEASKMAEVYSNAFLTIAAAHSEDDKDGFLSLRPSICVPVELQTGDSNLYVSKLKIEGAPFQNDFQLMDNEPLHKRAWTLQERYLSPRVLHYTKYQMFWECNGCVTAERGGQTNRTCCFASILRGHPQVDPPWFPSWIELVEKYSCRKLTVASDRLPALSGMASRLADATGAEYCAGVWKIRILHGLSWQKKWSRTNYRSEDILPGPSWSWASISDPILFHPRVLEERSKPYVAHATVLNYDLEVEGENMYGAVRSGRLNIRGPVLKIEPKKRGFHLLYWDRDIEEKYPCFVLLLWTQGNGKPLDAACQARGFIGLIIRPLSKDHQEFQRVGLIAPGLGKPRKDLSYTDEDLRDIVLV